MRTCLLPYNRLMVNMRRWYGEHGRTAHHDSGRRLLCFLTANCTDRCWQEISGRSTKGPTCYQ